MFQTETARDPQRKRDKRHTTPTGFKILCDVDITADPEAGKTTGSTVVTRYFVNADGGSPELMEVTAYATRYERNGKILHRLHTGGADLDELAVAVRDKDIMALFESASEKKARLMSLDVEWEVHVEKPVEPPEQRVNEVEPGFYVVKPVQPISL